MKGLDASQLTLMRVDSRITTFRVPETPDNQIVQMLHLATHIFKPSEGLVQKPSRLNVAQEKQHLLVDTKQLYPNCFKSTAVSTNITMRFYVLASLNIMEQSQARTCTCPTKPRTLFEALVVHVDETNLSNPRLLHYKKKKTTKKNISESLYLLHSA